MDTERFHQAADAAPSGASDGAPASDGETTGGPPDDDRFTVHFQGRLIARTRPARLVEAVAASTGDWRLTIGEDDPRHESLERRVRETGVGDRVTFLGYVPDAALPARYAASDLFVLPSAYEGMPLTVLEALASGTPVLASPRAATDVVSDTVRRVLEPDPLVLARTLDALARQPWTVAGLSEAACERALGYDRGRVAAEFESLFADLTGEAAPGPARARATGGSSGRAGHTGLIPTTVPGADMEPTEVERIVREALPDARVEVTRARGSHDDDHLSALVVSPAFEGESLVAQHDRVYDALDEHMTTDIHALELSTYTPEAFAESDARFSDDR